MEPGTLTYPLWPQGTHCPSLHFYPNLWDWDTDGIQLKGLPWSFVFFLRYVGLIPLPLHTLVLFPRVIHRASPLASFLDVLCFLSSLGGSEPSAWTSCEVNAEQRNRPGELTVWSGLRKRGTRGSSGRNKGRIGMGATRAWGLISCLHQSYPSQDVWWLSPALGSFNQVQW